jgi:hypothetical protein
MTPEQQLAATRRAAEDATTQARTAVETGGAPPQRISVVRPVLPARTQASGPAKAASADSTR